MNDYEIIEELTSLANSDWNLHATFDNLYIVANKVGLHDRTNHALRVKWINNLRKIVDRRMPVNKMGSPMTSDVDLMTANADEMAEAILRTMNKWKE
jgi:hypothetical protein